jgi:hypothetical protein
LTSHRDLRQDRGRHVVGPPGEAKQQMLGTEVVMPEPAGLILREDDRAARAFGQSVERTSHGSRRTRATDVR